MKNIITIILFATLTVSCSMFGAKFDNNEYARLVNIEVIASTSIPRCNNFDLSKSNIKQLMYESNVLLTYTRYLPNNEETHKIATILHGMISKMHNRYQTTEPSESYCKINLLIITQSAKRALSSIAQKVR